VTVAKPDLPARWLEPIERIQVDQNDGSDYSGILGIADHAASHWMVGPDGPYKNPSMTGAQATRGAINEALLHLLELGLIDIDSERLSQMLEKTGIPIGR
jgi:hypothetical protein